MRSPLITFIIPLKSPQVSQDWHLVSELCFQTLNSILRQTCSDFKIILVCNSPPNNYPDDSRLQVICDNFPIPQQRSDFFLDQKLKIKRGMIACQGFGSGYVMRIDADDFIHRDLVKFVSQNTNENGWYFERGYVYQKGSPWIYLRGNFHLTTASSHIVRLTERDLPVSMETPDSEYFVDLWQHLRLKATCEQSDRPLKPMPFRAAAYTIGHPESVMLHSLVSWNSIKKNIWKTINRRSLTPDLVYDFGFPSFDDITT